MNFTVLGSGSSYPSTSRGAPCHVVSCHDRSILLDAGEGCTRALQTAGIDFTDLDAICITHFHTDHVGGFVPLLFAMNLFARRTKPLVIAGPPGLFIYLKAQYHAHADWLQEMPFELVTFQLTGERTVAICADLSVMAYEVPHKDVSLGYRIESDEGVIAFSGDARMSESLIALAYKADLFVCESGYADEQENPNHLSWTQIGQLAKQARVGQLVLTHFHEVMDLVKLNRYIKTNYKGKLSLANDGDIFNVQYLD